MIRMLDETQLIVYVPVSGLTYISTVTPTGFLPSPDSVLTFVNTP